MGHTKGEWVQELSHGHRIVRSKKDKLGFFETVCNLEYANNLFEKEEANAKLIAQTPKFLEAAKKLMDEVNSVTVEFPESTWDALNELEEAIKASE